MSVANTQTDTRTTRRTCVPHNNKNLFSTFYLSHPIPVPIPLVQHLDVVVVMCIRIHIIITHSPRCTGDILIAQHNWTELNQTEQTWTQQNSSSRRIISQNSTPPAICRPFISPPLCPVGLWAVCLTVFCLQSEHVCINILTPAAAGSRTIKLYL